MAKFRIESDAIGQIKLPADALHGINTARAEENFKISGWVLPERFIRSLGLIKLACAQVNLQASRLKKKTGDAIVAAARQVADGKQTRHFPLDVFQTGSATSTNMNANEVIANLACRILRAKPGDKSVVHPNDHVNMAQSSNDVIPTAIHVAAACAISEDLLPALKELSAGLRRKSRQFDSVVKIGRTHLMDAVPVRLGQEFSGYAAQIERAAADVKAAINRLLPLPLGGTAVGTGLNCPKGFARAACRAIARETHLPFRESDNHFASQASMDAALAVSGAMKTCAIAMGKIASDIRLMGGGPRCGLGELFLPSTQAGSSIMPGKVNPVICESVVQVACQVVGCDAAITAGTTGGVGGILELNVAMPMIAWNLLTQIRLLSAAAANFNAKCIAGLQANKQRCKQMVEQSLAMITVLAPRIGYDKSAAIAKKAFATGKTIRQLCMEEKLLPVAELNKLLDARSQTGK